MARMHFLSVALLLLISLSIVVVVSADDEQKVVTTLPGFDGELPFYLETGYIGVGDLDESQLFYYFVESQRSPSEDPLILWLTGGPGCSVLSAFIYESGPITFNYDGYKGGLPSLHLNPWAWTQGANIIYVDSPIGTGFSYTTNAEMYPIDDYRTVEELYEFLRKWLIKHPQFLENNLFIGGDSYSGIPVPMLTWKIYEGISNQTYPVMNLQGYILGNPKTDDFIDDNSRVPFAHRLTLLSDELYAETAEACDANYLQVNASNAECETYLDTIDDMLQDINLMHVLEPNCKTASSRPVTSLKGERRSLQDNYDGFFKGLEDPAFWCREYHYVLSGIWSNNVTVRSALGIRQGTKGEWTRCNGTISYTKTVPSSVEYHVNLTTTNLRALIYSGDHDLSVTHMGTQSWISALNLTLYDSWRPWFVDGQVVGYTEEYIGSEFTLDFATVKGAGHVAPEYKGKECYAMITRWLAAFPV